MKGKAIILTMFIAVCMSCSAYAAELVIESSAMNYETDSYNISVHHSGSEIRPITVQMKNSETNERSYFSEFLTDEEGNASLKIPMNSERNPSGEYIIRLSGADITEPAEITAVYVNKSDAENIITAIKNNSSGLADYIRENIYGVGLDANVKGMWDSIGTGGQDAAVGAIAGKSFSNIGEVEDAFSYAICTLRLNSADSASIESVICEVAEYLGLDIGENSYYSQLKSRQTVLTALMDKSFPLASYSGDKSGVKAAFDTSVALAWINGAEISERDNIISVIKNSNDYLELPLDGAYAGLSGANQKNVIMGILTYRPIADKTALRNAFDNSLRNYTSNNNGTGGSSAVGGGGSSPNKNVSPTIISPDPDPEPTAEPWNEEEFRDIENHWAREYIQNLLEKDIVSGTGEGCFSPDRSILREEFVKIIVKAMSMAANNSISVYEDVRTDQWYYPYIVTAEKSGLVRGISETEFGIGRNISRQDMAVLVSRMLSMKGIMLDVEEKESFADRESIADYAVEAVNALRNLGIISGDDRNAFNPQNGATRAEVAKIISEAMRIMDSKE